MKKALLFMVLAAALAGCGKPHPPVGKWEGGYESGGDLVVARVEILPSGQVKLMAPDITNAVGPRDQIEEYRARLSADLTNGWSEVAPRSFDFDGKTFRKPGGDRKSTRLNSSHLVISYAVFCLKKKKRKKYTLNNNKKNKNKKKQEK